ncbi:MAG: DUF4340 domain-containing protein [Gorillibacterium sp.]|nr:DUF4340 domain-containing protein [Gorillibacterium sp.]
MKRLLPTLALMLICVVGFWYGSEKGLFNSQTKVEKPTLLFTLGSDQITGLTLSTGAEDIELSKDAGVWVMKRPMAYPLNTYGTDGWLNSFCQLTYVSIVDENPTDVAQYGLDKPLGQYTVSLNDGTKRKLLVGKPLVIAGSSYVQIEGSPIVYEVNDTDLQGLAVPVLNFVDSQAVRVEYNDVKTIDLTWKGQTWQLTKSELAKMAYESKWTMGTKGLTPEEGSGILDKLTGLSTDVLPTSAKDGKLANPELSIVVTEEREGKSTTSTFSGKINGELVMLHKDGDEWTYSLALDKVQALYDLGKAGGKAAE